MSTPSPWPYFSTEELTCRCGCGQMRMDDDFMQGLVDLREVLDVPLVITSGYRCPEYNERISSTGRDGPHTTGCAVDVNIRGDEAYYMLMEVMRLGYFSGVGIKQKGPWDARFVHLDSLTPPEFPRPRVWTY